MMMSDARKVVRLLVKAIRSGEIQTVQRHENPLIGGPVFQYRGQRFECHMGKLWIPEGRNRIVGSDRRVRRALVESGLWPDEHVSAASLALGTITKGDDDG